MADADILLSSTTHSDARAVRVTTGPCHAGPGNTLSINPLNWHAFVQAYERTLPASDPVQATSTATHTLPAAAPPCDMQGAHILVTEDHPINHELIAKQLRLLGYHVTLAEDGMVALRRLREHRFDALLTDCHMPRMDDFGLVRHIRHEEGDGPRLPIITITTTTLAKRHACCRAVGIGTSLLKPTTLTMLQEALSALCAGNVRANASGAAEKPPTLSLDDLHAALGADPAAISLAQVFLSSLAGNTQRLQPLLDAMGRRALRRWAHRTGGALALLHNPSVDVIAETLRHVMHNSSVNTTRAVGAHTMRLLTHINGLFSAFGSPAADVVHRAQVTGS